MDPVAFWTMISALVLVASAVIAGAAFIVIIFQLRASRQIAAADLILRIEESFVDRHEPIYKKFQNGGPWTTGQAGPKESERSDVEHYLDFFGSLQLLREKHLLDLETIDKMFAFCFFSVAHNIHTIDIMETNRTLCTSYS